MYQDECDRRMRSAGGGSSSKDGRGSSYSRGGNNRDGDQSSSYRDRSSRDGGRSYSSGSYDQYQNNSSSRGGSSSAGSAAGNAPPPSSGPQPLMAQQFNPPQPMMGLMGHSPFQFAPPPASLSGRKWCRMCISVTQHNTNYTRADLCWIFHFIALPTFQLKACFSWLRDLHFFNISFRLASGVCVENFFFQLKVGLKQFCVRLA